MIPQARYLIKFSTNQVCHKFAILPRDASRQFRDRRPALETSMPGRAAEPLQTSFKKFQPIVAILAVDLHMWPYYQVRDVRDKTTVTQLAKHAEVLV